MDPNDTTGTDASQDPTGPEVTGGGYEPEETARADGEAHHEPAAEARDQPAASPVPDADAPAADTVDTGARPAEPPASSQPGPTSWGPGPAAGTPAGEDRIAAEERPVPEEPSAADVAAGPDQVTGADRAGDTGDQHPDAAAQPALDAAAAAGLRSGEIVIGTVRSVDAEEVVLDLASGGAGVIGRRHFTASGQTAPSELVSVGDQVEAAVLVRDDPKGRIVLSRAWALKQRAWEQVEEARKANRPLTGLVTGQVKGGLVVDVGTRAFLPASHVDLHHVDDLAPFVGQPVEALVLEADKANDKIVLSRRNLLRQHERAKAASFAATLAAGQVHRGRVSLLTDFGAFVDVGGVRGLVHLSELSWRRVERAGDVVAVGDEVDVKVLSIKPGRKVSLSMRALQPDPLSSVSQGDVVPGVVTRLADFGAFVRIGEGAEGLVHVTELAEYRVHAPEEVVAPGDEVLVKVLRVDRKRRRVDLSVNQALLS